MRGGRLRRRRLKESSTVRVDGKDPSCLISLNFTLLRRIPLGDWNLSVWTYQWEWEKDRLIVATILRNLDESVRLEPGFELVDDSGFGYRGEVSFLPSPLQLHSATGGASQAFFFSG